MIVSRVIGFSFLAVVGASAAIAACGSDGAKGEAGVAGVAGATGQPGAPGAPGAIGLPGVLADGGSPLSGACTMPCHTFGGVVDQWRFSNHSHPQENEVGGGSCGNCHGIDGLQQRVANSFNIPADAGVPSNVASGHLNYSTTSGAVSEIGYGGATTIGRIHCSTCHDFNATNDPHVTGKYVAGQAPLRVPGGVANASYIEATDGLSPTTSTGQSLAYRSGNTCVFCHKSRKDVAFYIKATGNVLSSHRWGPHNGPQTDVYSGKGGYHFAGLTYGTSAHVTVANACVSCHMVPASTNGNVPDHTMKPTLAFCKTCHTQYNGKTFDIQGGQSLVSAALAELQMELNNAGLLTRSGTSPFAALTDDERSDRQFHMDSARPGGGAGGVNIVADGPLAGALYNYLIVARSKDLGVHNPTYAKQLLWDSIKQVKNGSVGGPLDPTSLPARPQ